MNADTANVRDLMCWNRVPSLAPEHGWTHVCMYNAWLASTQHATQMSISVPSREHPNMVGKCLRVQRLARLDTTCETDANKPMKIDSEWLSCNAGFDSVTDFHDHESTAWKTMPTVMRAPP